MTAFGSRSPKPAVSRVLLLFSVHAKAHPPAVLGLRFVRLTPTQDLGRLPHFNDAVSWQHAAEIGSRINNAVTTNDRAGIQDRIASNFGTISDDRAKLPQAGRNHSIDREN